MCNNSPKQTKPNPKNNPKKDQQRQQNRLKPNNANTIPVLWEQGAASSNPGIPTTHFQRLTQLFCVRRFLLLQHSCNNATFVRQNLTHMSDFKAIVLVALVTAASAYVAYKYGPILAKRRKTRNEQ